jgi:alanyl-tRNA synthetase
MNGQEIRELFLAYFEEKKHHRVSSSNLVPENDPTLLFTNAGMVQFKNVFLGGEKRDFSRATTSQKCLRVSGKHNDLENVGHTARHHTFFEMLGNFSFGDYFKSEACRFAYELLVERLELPLEKLYFTIFETDDEAFEIWRDEMNIPVERIVRLGEKDNFWSMGDTGPCGPCSEIIYDQGAGNVPCDNPNCDIYCECDRHLEIWNLVFMQYDRDAEGKLNPLPKPSIDTGMGLERITAVKQGVYTNYDTDLFQPIIEHTAKLAGIKYNASDASDAALRVIADHARSATFLIGDGILPSNEGRGYVLRRIMRRAARYGKKIGLDNTFLTSTSGVVIDLMQQAFPELSGRRKFIEEVISNEESRFLETLDKGLALLAEEIKSLKAQQAKVIPGEVAFKLYDTFGFPVDLTEVIASEEGLSVDEDGFKKEMQAQRERGRSSWKSGEVGAGMIVDEKSEFIGYDNMSGESEILGIYLDGKKIDRAEDGNTVDITVSQTPFYAESGGQIGDIGSMEWNGGKGTVESTFKAGEGSIVHRVKVDKGNLEIGQKVKLSVDKTRRRDTMRNHSATHLLQAALIDVLGDHVKQAGSDVNADRLRFDFSHFHAITEEELDRVELQVNESIRANLPVSAKSMAYKEALHTGAMAIFGEKYGDVVRLVSMGDVSAELCGGTHVSRTGDIGFFNIATEQGIAAGVRRIEAVTGRGAIERWQQIKHELEGAAAELKTTPAELTERISRLKGDNKKLERDVADLKTKLAAGGSKKDLLDEAFPVETGKALVARVDLTDPKLMREFGDTLCDRLDSGILVLGAETDGKAQLMIMVKGEAEKSYHAGNMVKELAPLFGGRGGGKPTMAQAGGGDPSKLEAVLEKARQLLKG